MRFLSVAVCGLLLATAVPRPAAAVTEIKIATVAPRGSMWARIFNKMKKKILKATGGEVKLRFYFGQVQGDERDVVRKMRTGQLHGGGFTSVGLSMLNPNVLVMQMPGMLGVNKPLEKMHKSLDRLKKVLEPDFDKSFRAKGYVALGWAEVGPIHVFSKKPIPNVKTMRKQKVWAWSDDPISGKFLKELKVAPRKLGLPGVLPGLNTGIINTVFNSPLGCMALQWHTKVKYMSEQPSTVSIGATVITKKVFDKLEPKHQKILLELSGKYHDAMIKRGRKDNESARKALLKSGISAVKFSTADIPINKAAADRVRKAFVPRYFSAAILNKAIKHR